MTKSVVLKWVLIGEAVGFFLLILFIWLNEVADIPERIFGGMDSPANITEAAIESIAALILGLSTMVATRRILSRLRYLEGFLPVCSFCKKIRLPNESWIPIEQYIRDHSEAVFTHSYCPDCMQKHYGEYLGAK